MKKMTEESSLGGQLKRRKVIEKGESCKMSPLDDKMSLLTKRIIRQSGQINELLLSYHNYTMVNELMELFDDEFQVLVELQQEMTELSDEDSGESWFTEINE